MRLVQVTMIAIVNSESDFYKENVLWVIGVSGVINGGLEGP